MRSRNAPLLSCAFLSCSIFFQQSLFGQDLEQTFDQMDRSAQSFHAMTANIKRMIHTAAINDDSIDAGSMKLRRTKRDTKMLIEFTGKEAKTVALEGREFRIFYPRTNTIQVWDIGNNRGLVDQFLLLGFGATSEEMKKAYTVKWAGKALIDGQETGHLILTPKSTEVLKKLKQAELWISEARGVPLQQKFVTSADGDSTMVTYSSMKTNPSLTDSDLQLKLPKGVVIEHPQKN